MPCCNSESNITRPFEWLTSPASLDAIVKECLRPIDTGEARVLHVGCGNSGWGEHVLNHHRQCSLIVNVDKDIETLERTKHNWEQRFPDDNRMQFQRVDFLVDRVDTSSQQDTQGFHLILDKSTLDCTLCSDQSSAALLCEVYRNLNASCGMYLLVSFHNVGLLQPLLEELPGAQWKVEHRIIERQVEDLITKGTLDPPIVRDSPIHVESSTPDDLYRRTVNVFVCSRVASDSARSELDLSLVSEHVHKVSDDWFKSQNPMLSDERRKAIYKAFENGSAFLDLPTCYQILFSEEERNHLEFDFFLEDWSAFLSSSSLPVSPGKDGMTFELAIAFLTEMQ